MKTSRLLIALVGCAAFSGALAQETAQPELTAEQIVEKHIEATGGKAAYEKQKTLVVKGRLEMTGQGIGGALTSYQKAPNKVLTVLTLGQLGDFIRGYDGKIAWGKDAIGGLRKLQGAEKEQLIREASVSPLTWKTYYKSMTLEGKVKIEDRDAYKLVFTPKTGKPSSYFFDAETFLVVRTDATQESEAGSISVETYLSDYRDVDGVKMPFKTVAKAPQGEMTLTLTEVKMNVPIADSKFAYPAAKPAPTKPKAKTGVKTGTNKKK